MRKRDSLSRSLTSSIAETRPVRQIICGTALKALISEWMQNEGWQLENFADFLKLIGIESMATLSNLNQADNSFKCTTAFGKEAKIRLFFGDKFDYFSKIEFTIENKSTTYLINSNCNSTSIPTITLYEQKINSGNRTLDSFYSPYSFDRTLQLDKYHLLRVKFEPKQSLKNNQLHVLENSKAIEKYLLDLSTPWDVDDIYKTIIKLLGFSSRDITLIKSIDVSYLNVVNNCQENIISRIFLQDGIMQEYAIFENNSTFHVFRGGDWKYSSFSNDRSTQISFVEETRQTIFNFVGPEEDIIVISPHEILAEVKKRISELQKFVQD